MEFQLGEVVIVQVAVEGSNLNGSLDANPGLIWVVEIDDEVTPVPKSDVEPKRGELT